MRTRVAAIALFALWVPAAACGQAETGSYFASYLGGSLDDSIRDVAIDASGNQYIAGGTGSANFPVTAGSWDTSFNTGANGAQSGPHDAFVAKLSPDGVLLWSTLVGGDGYDRAYALEIDATGVYVCGRAGIGFPTTANALQRNFGGDLPVPNGNYGPQDGFVAKLSLDGTQLLWATYFGGADSSLIRDCAIDAQGNVYVVLPAVSATNPHVTAGAFQTALGGSKDGVVAKISADGQRVIWGSYLGGSSIDLGTSAIRVDSQGQAVVAGFTASTNFPVTNGAFQPTFGGGNGDMTVTKFSADGSSLVFSTYVGGSDVEFSETHCLWIDALGSIYLAATTKSANLPTSMDSFQRTYGGSGVSRGNYPGDGFITKLTPNGAHVITTYLGGNDGDGIEGVTIDADGMLAVSGATFSSNFPIAGDAIQTSKGQLSDYFLARLTPDLSDLVYSTYLGGDQDDWGRSVAAGGGLLSIVGMSASSDFPVTDSSSHAVTAPNASPFDGALTTLTIAVVPEPHASASGVASLATLAWLAKRFGHPRR